MYKLTDYKIKIYIDELLVQPFTSVKISDYANSKEFETEIKEWEIPTRNSSFMTIDDNQEIIHKVTKMLLDEYNSSVIGLKALFTKKKTAEDVLPEVKEIISQNMLRSHFKFDSTYSDGHGTCVILKVIYDPSLEAALANNISKEETQTKDDTEMDHI